MAEHHPGGPFVFAIGDRVTVTFPTGRTQLARVTGRTTEAALGKTYKLRSQRGRNLGWLPESYLSPR